MMKRINKYWNKKEINSNLTNHLSNIKKMNYNNNKVNKVDLKTILQLVNNNRNKLLIHNRNKNNHYVLLNL